MTDWKVLLTERAEKTAQRAAAAEARSERTIARLIELGTPPSEKELAQNRQTLGLLKGIAEKAQKDLDKWLASHPD